MGIKPALFWFFLIALLAVIWKLLDLPSEEKMVIIVSEWLTEYGLLTVLIGSFLETLLFVGFYFPGSLIIFISVAVAPTPSVAFLNVLVVSMGMFLGYSCNYILGRYGWYTLFLKLGMKSGIENAQIKMQRNDMRYIFYTFWNPGLASFSSTAAGTLHIPYLRLAVLMVLALSIWNTFWRILVYSLGESALSLLNFSLVLKMIGVWILFELLVLVWKKIRKPRMQ